MTAPDAKWLEILKASGWQTISPHARRTPGALRTIQRTHPSWDDHTRCAGMGGSELGGPLGSGVRFRTMSYQTQAELLLAQAKFADDQAKKVKDRIAKASWVRIAESCRDLAQQYRDMAKGKPPPQPKL